MSLLRLLACWFFGHQDIRIISANPKDGTLWRCAYCEDWGLEEP